MASWYHKYSDDGMYNTGVLLIKRVKIQEQKPLIAYYKTLSNTGFANNSVSGWSLITKSPSRNLK